METVLQLPEELVGLYGFIHLCILASPSNEQRKPGSNQSLKKGLQLPEERPVHELRDPRVFPPVLHGVSTPHQSV